MTANQLAVLEFRYGRTTRLKWIIGRWPLDQVQVPAADAARRRLKVSLPGRHFTLELEGVYRSQAEIDVVAALREGCGVT